MATVIDADTHVVESEAMWEFFDEERRHLKLVLVATPDPATGRIRNRWVIGNRLVPHPAGFGGHNAQAPPADPEVLASPFWGGKSLQTFPTGSMRRPRWASTSRLCIPPFSSSI